MLVLAVSPWASTQILRTVYLGDVLGTTRYGLALAASANLTELNKMHRRALCVVTGCHVSMPDVMLMTEAAIPSIEDLAREEAVKLQEHLLRLPERAPGRLACECGQLATTGWLHEAERLADKLQLCKLLREPLQLTMPFAPWEQPTPMVIHTVEGCNRQMEDEMDVVAKVRRRTNFYFAYDVISSHQPLLSPSWSWLMRHCDTPLGARIAGSPWVRIQGPNNSCTINNFNGAADNIDRTGKCTEVEL